MEDSVSGLPLLGVFVPWWLNCIVRVQPAYGNRQTGEQQSYSRPRMQPAEGRASPRPRNGLPPQKRSPGTQVPGLLRTFQSKVYDWPPGSPSLAYFAPDWSTMYFMGFTVVPLTCTS